MARFTEKGSVEDYILTELQKKGWSFVPAIELDRDSYDEPLLVRNLIRKVRDVNETALTDDDINNVLKNLKFKACTQEGVKAILNYLKEGVSIKLEKERVIERVRLFDFEDIKNNEFIITRQAHYVNGELHKILDIVLYVNGIPLVNIECKNPASFSEDWTNAYNDIKAYEEAIPELYKYIQIGAAVAETARYFPIVPWQKEDIRTEEWKTDDTKNPLDALLQMLAGETLLDIIRNFIFYRIEFGKATKVITRYMQYRAVNRIFRRVIDNLEGKNEKKKGLIWHWQGSGKTLEMIFAAYKLYHHRSLENPSVFLIVDRTELEEQLGREFNALDITKPDVISSIHGLRQVLKHDGYKGKRGIMMTLIHKFRPEELAEVDREMK
ncbi:MAG: HsdR family type I site-specific deoxyribonuclease, partial [Nitrospirota bacterium]